ncbi:MAG TPA: ACP S-malonyltransferase [Acholeplasma sp.]|nr:ACP S-malonyltransferase [Acholeplasma sp.]
MKTLLMFSGQGSQYPNMGLDVINLVENKDKIKLAEEILGFNIKTALKNENNELSQTKYTQPLMVLVSILLFDEFKRNFNFDGLLGFSLGEYSALYAANIYDFETIINIVKVRSELMEDAANKNPGKMAAVLNFETKKLEEVVNKHNNDHDLIVTIANYNAKSQLVISGNDLGVNKVIDELKALGVRRIIPLNVSGGFHSLLMKDSSNKLYEYLITQNKNKNIKPLYLNTTSKELVINDLEKELQKQMYSSVLFYQSIENTIKDGYTRFIEIGPGKVLRNLVSKNYENIEVLNVENIEDLKSLEEN